MIGFLKRVTHDGGDMIFQEGNLSLIYVGPYKILQGVAKVAYELGFPHNAAVNPVIHISAFEDLYGWSSICSTIR